MIYEAERCSGTFKVTYDNKWCNRCPRKREADKHFAEAPFVKLPGGHSCPFHNHTVPPLPIAKRLNFGYAVCNTNCAKEMNLHLAKYNRKQEKCNGQKTTGSTSERRDLL